MSNGSSTAYAENALRVLLLDKDSTINNVTKKQVESAFRRLSFECHPDSRDKNLSEIDKQSADQRFYDISEAKNELLYWLADPDASDSEDEEHKGAKAEQEADEKKQKRKAEEEGFGVMILKIINL